MQPNTLGFTIRSLRLRMGLTQAALADLVGVTDKAVSKWERGISFPDIGIFPKLADVLGVTIDDLLRGSGEDGRAENLERLFEFSHAVRTPLHVILGCTEMAKNHRFEPELVKRYLENIRISGEYLLGNIEEILRPGLAGEASVKQENDEEQAAGRRSIFGENASSDLQDILDRLGASLGNDAAVQGKASKRFHFTGKRILVADDMAINREIVGEILKPTGAVVDFAEDGEACVAKIKDAPALTYDLVLMDILMPHKDGLAATREIRQLEDPAKAKIPVIAMTANVFEKNRREALAAGMNAFTEKPVFAERLLSVMAEYLG